MNNDLPKVFYLNLTSAQGKLGTWVSGHAIVALEPNGAGEGTWVHLDGNRSVIVQESSDEIVDRMTRSIQEYRERVMI